MREIALSIIDMEPFLKGGTEDRVRVARAFGAAFEDTGFAVIVGHGIPEPLIGELYETLLDFFAQPLEAKMRWLTPEKANRRGYLPIGVESVARTLSGETPPDLCEALVFNAIHRELAGAPARNIWPDEPRGLRAMIEDYARRIVDLTRALGRMSALALDLAEDYFDPYYSDPAMTLRFVNYPDQVEPPKPGQLRYGEHHDYGTLTILRQDAAPGGLQIFQGGDWLEAPRIPESFVINVGDLLARWTNDRWKSTLHRVSNPPRELTGSTQRLSLVAFSGPNDSMEVACLPTCTDAANPPRYAPVRAGDYIRGKIAASMELTATP